LCRTLNPEVEVATVSDILGRKGDLVVTVPASASVLEAAQVMNEHGIGGVVVTDEGEMVGVFTERDILRRVVASYKDPSQTLLRDVLTYPIVTVRPDTSLEGCRGLITQKRIRHIPVVGDFGLCGIITSGDILAFQMEEQKDTIEHLSSYVFDLR
jgi:CBS domain-containing protein